MTEEFIPLGKLFSELAKNYVGVLAENLEKKTGINRYFYALIVIHRGKGMLTQQELSGKLCNDKVITVRIIDYLSKNGLVKRSKNEADRRAHCLVLTPKAEKLLPEIIKVYEELEAKVFQGISESKIKEFKICMEKMSANMAQLPSQKMNVKLEKNKITYLYEQRGIHCNNWFNYFLYFLWERR